MIVTTTSRVTSGSVNLPVKFHFKGDEWDDLVKTAVFIGSGEERDVALITDECAVPADVLAEAGGDLKIGVYGRLANGATVIPTIWGRVQYIYEGTEMSEPSPHDPEPDWTAQVQQAAATALTKATAVEEAAARGDFDGISPAVTISEITHGHSVTITDRDHPTGQSFPVLDGDSAYEQAVAGGYEGTEAQFNEELASFKELSDEAKDAAPFYAEYGVTTKAEIETAINGKRQIYLHHGNLGGIVAPYTGTFLYADIWGEGTGYGFALTNGNFQYVYELKSEWTYSIYDLTAPAQRAETAAAAAASSKTEAEGSATAAASSATAAAGSASDAATAKTAAEAAQTAAAASAAGASDSADSAASSATAASGSATSAASSATAAGNAQAAAETAQGAAEDAQEAAEAVLASIPADYTELSGDVDSLKRAINQKADYYYQTATGSNLEILNAIPETDVQSLVVTTAYTQTGSGSPSLTNVRPITCVTELTLSQKGSATGTAVDHTFDLDESTPVGVGDLSYNGDGTWTLTGKYVLVSVDYGFFSSATDIVFPSSGTTFYIKNPFYYEGNGVSYKNRSIIKGGYFCASNAFDAVALNNSSYNASQRRLYLSNSGGWTTKDAFLQSVQDYYNNGGTVQFLYEPTDEIPETTYTSEELNKLTGTDYFTTNVGEISVTYMIDLLKEINEANDHIDSVDEVNSFPKEDVLTANDDAVNKIRASRWLRSSTASPLSLLWFSDPHRHTSSLKRIVKFKEYLKANSLIEESICTGDLVHGSINEGSYYEKFWYGTEGTEDILIVVGNHEHYENSVSPHGKASLSTIDGVMFKDIANWGVEREDYNTFYYKDYPEQSIRLIVADPAIVTSVDGVDEEAWLDTTLSGARTLGYSVVIASHYLKLDESTETKSVTIYDNGWSNNLARATATSTMGYDWSNSCDIVKCVTEFIADGGSFLCYLIGHTHTDIVSYPTGHQDQLIISLASASSERDHATKLTTNDLPRYDSTKTQDCFNVITFDTTNKIIKCVRVGANMNMYEQPRTAFAYDVQNHTFLSVI